MTLAQKLTSLPLGILLELAGERVKNTAKKITLAGENPLDKVVELEGLASPIWRARADHLNLAVEYVTGAAVEGDFVEFGTFTGKTASVIAASMAALNLKRHFYLLDSFLGFPKAEGVDKELPFVKNKFWGEGRAAGLMTPDRL